METQEKVEESTESLPIIPEVDMSSYYESKAPTDFDMSAHFRNSFREDLIRDQMVRGEIYERTPKALNVIDKILSEETTDKNRREQLDASKYILTNAMLNSEKPQLQFAHTKIEKITTTDKNPRNKMKRERVQVTKQEVTHFLAIAAKAELEMMKLAKEDSRKEESSDKFMAEANDGSLSTGGFFFTQFLK